MVYLRLSEYLDPHQVIIIINGLSTRKYKLNAFIPDNIPDLPPCRGVTQIKGHFKRRYCIPIITEPGHILTATHKEVMCELQYIYTALYALSAKYKHKLLNEIARITFQRLKHILDTKREANEGCFKLSMCYRMIHTHSTDFQLILSTLHAVQDAMGVPRTELKESQLYLSQSDQGIHNLPYSKVEQICNKYSEKISNKMNEHINNLVIDESPVTEKDIARKKVRQELMKISPYISKIIGQVITDSFYTVSSNELVKGRMYGDPYMPDMNVMKPFMKKFQAKRIRLCDRMFNNLQFLCPVHMLEQLLDLNGTYLGDTKLIIRKVDKPVLSYSKSFIKELKDNYGFEYKNDEEEEDDDDDDANMDEDDEEEWQEPWE
ncbi:uncharacterized protein ACR2FA_002140 [Aphomia sociella]